MSHQVLANRGNEIARLIRVLIFLGLRRYVGDFANVDEVLNVKLELQVLY